jgi:beta-lactamase regulating signal transducer with metallopeptidase domain
METISRTLLTFLLNALWQVPVAWAVAALACRLMPNGPARHRHAVWVAALFAAFLLPALSVRAPQRPTIQLPPANLTEIATPAAPRASTIAPAPTATAAIPVISFSHDWAMILLGAYGLFLALRAAQLLRALFRTFEIRRDAAPGDLPALLARCEAAFSANGVKLLRSRDIAGPVALHRAIILPDDMFDESREEVLATALGHEMAHIARHDFLWKLIYELVYLPLSFHPAAIFVRRGIENTREMACDELVTLHLLEPAVYARSIMTIAGAISRLDRPGYALGVFDGDILEERIRSLMERRGGDLRRARIAVIGALSTLAL